MPPSPPRRIAAAGGYTATSAAPIPGSARAAVAALLFAAIATALTAPSAATAMEPSAPGASTRSALPSPQELFQLSIGELMNIPITTASRTPNDLIDTAAAVFVVTEEEIRRSGANTLPDILRMVPGMEVAAFNGNTWAVSARGLNDVYSRMLLVLVDGRRLYNERSSQVWWGRLDLLPEEIERIEVIRGPGGGVWGSNAVNGVVNIITKSSHDTHGGLAVAELGEPGEVRLGLRHGAAMADGASYRIYTQLRSRDGYPEARFDNHWQTGLLGFRYDDDPSDHARWRVTGDLMWGESGSSYWNPLTATDDHHLRGHLMAHREIDGDQGSLWNYSLFVDYDSGEAPHATHAASLGLELLNRSEPIPGHRFSWGFSYRTTRWDGENEGGFTVLPNNGTNNQVSLFAQDEFELLPEQLAVTLGAKLESLDRSDETLLMPNLRLLWKVDEGLSLWTALSRAFRTPSVLARNATLEFEDRGVRVRMLPDPDNHSEELRSVEVGARAIHGERFSWDLVLFRSHYRDLLRRFPEWRSEGDGPYIAMPANNSTSGALQGAELAVNWEPHERLSLRLAYTALEAEDEGGTLAVLAEADPDHQLSLRAGWRFNDATRLDGWLRYSDRLCAFSMPVLAGEDGCVERYTTLDLRLSHRLDRKSEVSLVGRNLLERRHQEFDSNGGNVLAATIPRSVLLQFRRSF